MIRYVAIGAVVGFLLSVLLLSRSVAPALEPAIAPPSLEAPIRPQLRGEARLPISIQRNGPSFLRAPVEPDAGP